jgi:hypothetical protein
MKDRMKSKKVVAPLWCVDVHSSDYTRLALKDLQLKAYLSRVLVTARSSSFGGSETAGGGLSKTKSRASAGSKTARKKVKANYEDGHASWVEVDRRFDGIQVKALATGVPARSMRTVLSKKAFQQSLASCAFPGGSRSRLESTGVLPKVGLAFDTFKTQRRLIGEDKIGFSFRFCGRSSLTYPLASAGCLKDKVDGTSCLAFAEPKGAMAKSSMASAAANFVLRDLSLLFHPHARRQSPAAIFSKKLDELKSESGVWGAKALVGTEEVRGMKGVGVLSRVPTFSRPLLGVRFAVSGRLNGKDMASTVWASGGKLPRSWVSPKVNEDLICASPEGGRSEAHKGTMARLRSGGGLSYAAGTVPTRYGSLGLKVWLFF